MLTSLVRVLTFAMQDFFRNIWLSATTVVILVLTLVSVQVLIAVNVAGALALASLESRIDLRVQFRPEVSETEVDAIRVRLLEHEEVAAIEHTPRAAVLDGFQRLHEGNDDILNALAELNENPFGPELRIVVRRPEEFPILVKLLEDPQLTDRIMETGTADRVVLVEQLNTLTAKLRIAGIVLSATTFSVTLLIIINAMRIATYARREEVGIMKLVGATNWFVRTPFLIMGVIASILATTIVQVATFPALQAIEPTLIQFLGASGVDVRQFFIDHLWQIALMECVGLSLLTTIISAIAIRRYLRV